VRDAPRLDQLGRAGYGPRVRNENDIRPAPRRFPEETLRTDACRISIRSGLDEGRPTLFLHLEGDYARAALSPKLARQLAAALIGHADRLEENL
jgi:hypothetical protein